MTESPTRCIYLCLDGGSPVIESQVVDLLHALHESDKSLTFDLLLLGRRSDVEARKSSLFSADRHAEIEQKIGGMFVAKIFSNTLSGFLMTLWHLFRIIFPMCFTRKIVLIGRSKDGGFLGAVFKALCLGRPQLIYDQRGDVVAEYLYSIEDSVPSKFGIMGQFSLHVMYFMEWFGLWMCDRVLYVTENLRQVIKHRYRCAEKKAVAIFPCLADASIIKWSDENREIIRGQLGISKDQIVLTYGGSLKYYQCLDEMLDLYCAFQQLTNRAIFLFLTDGVNHGEIKRRLGALAPAESWRVLEANHNDVSCYFNAGDLGLLLRRKSPVNTSAAPTKFAEYAMSGLPIVMTEGIGDYSAQVREYNWGVTWPDLNNLQGLAADCLKWLESNGSNQTRLRIAAESSKLLSRQSKIKQYIEFIKL